MVKVKPDLTNRGIHSNANSEINVNALAGVKSHQAQWTSQMKILLQESVFYLVLKCLTARKGNLLKKNRRVK